MKILLAVLAYLTAIGVILNNLIFPGIVGGIITLVLLISVFVVYLYVEYKEKNK